MKKKRILKAISSLLTTLIFLVLLMTLFMFIATKASGGEPHFFGYQLKTVLSGSMEPEIKTGSILSIKKPDNLTAFKKGDIITFKAKEDMLVTHRIVEVKQDGEVYMTKGDANNAPDTEPVMADNIVGVYTGFTIPYLGYVLSFANTNAGAALLLVVPGILLLIYSAGTIWRAFRQLEQEKKAINEN